MTGGRKPSAGGGPAAGGRGATPPAPQVVRIFPALGDMFLRSATTVTIYNYLPVVPMVLGSALLMIIVSLLTRPPSQATIEKYFPKKQTAASASEPDPVAIS